MIGVLDTRPILIRIENHEDYVQLLYMDAFYVRVKEMYWQMHAEIGSMVSTRCGD